MFAWIVYEYMAINVTDSVLLYSRYMEHLRSSLRAAYVTSFIFLYSYIVRFPEYFAQPMSAPYLSVSWLMFDMNV